MPDDTPSDLPGTAFPENRPPLPRGLEWVRPLGEGSMAHVHLAREAELSRLVAVKVLRPEVVTDESARLRFEREARAAASLAHPNVIPIHHFGRLEDGNPYLVMAYVEGRTMADRLAAEGPLPEAEVRTVLAQLASALASAHRKGIVHRDVRAENVLLDEQTGRLFLSDFGIAAVLERGDGDNLRITRTGQLLGLPGYAPPEQLQGLKVTGQADVYSLGVLGYEMLTGEGPYRASNVRERIVAQMTAEPRRASDVRAGVSPDLDDLLLRCVAREPAHRPRPDDVLRRLEAGGAGGDSTGGGQDDRLGIVRRRIPQIVLSTLVGSVALVGLVASLVDIETLPEVSVELAINLAAWGLLASFVLAWFHGEKGRQEVTPVERWILASMAIGWLVATGVLLAR